MTWSPRYNTPSRSKMTRSYSVTSSLTAAGLRFGGLVRVVLHDLDDRGVVLFVFVVLVGFVAVVIDVRDLVEVVLVVLVALQDDPVELEQPLGRVGVQVLVDVRRAREPLPRLFPATRVEQRIGVRIPKPRRPRRFRCRG